MRNKIISKARELGFIAAGFSHVSRPLFIDEFKNQINTGKNADMAWLERNMHIREDPSKLLEDAKTIISLAYPYPCEKPATPDGYTVSRYSRPDRDDYHLHLRNLCSEVVKVITERSPENRSRICVDSAPLLERSFGFSAGIGFIGKNNMLIIPGYGSYFFLAEIITTYTVDFIESVPVENLCGECTMCIDACPTGALEGPFLLDAGKCLSYLTIESGNSIDASKGEQMGDCFLGCDRCQEVCPFNTEAEKRQICMPSISGFLDMSDEEFRKVFGRTALARPGLKKIQENIAILKR